MSRTRKPPASVSDSPAVAASVIASSDTPASGPPALDHIAADIRGLARPLAAFTPDPANARRHPERNLDAIRGSLARFGQRKPIVVRPVNGGLVVVAGNGTLECAKVLGWTHLAASVQEMTDSEATAYAIADNKTAELAEWDDDVLAGLLGTLDADLQAVTGFDDAEIEALISDAAGGTDGQTDPDDVPEQPPAISQRGDLWLMGKHRLICGDSTNAVDVNRVMGAEKADLCFTSPPYGAGNVAKLRDHYDPKAEKRASFYESHDDNPSNWPDLMRGWFVLAMANSSAVFCNVQLLADNKRSMIEWVNENRDTLCDVIVWDKINAAPQMQSKVLSCAFEFIWIFSADASRSIPFADFHGTIQNVVRIDPRGKNEFAGTHRAVMPTQLPEWLIGELCVKAQTIYEPFSGSGTTIIAAEKLGRRCFAIEIEPRYVDVAVQRWCNFAGKDATRESDGAKWSDLSTKLAAESAKKSGLAPAAKGK